MVAGRDSKGRFVKGNVPSNKRVASKRGDLTFRCRLCGEPKPFAEMAVARNFFPPLVACRDCCRFLQ